MIGRQAAMDLTGINEAQPHPALFSLGGRLFIPRGEVCVLASEPGVGKSLLALYLALSLALPESPDDEREPYTGIKGDGGSELTPCSSHAPRVVILSAEESGHTMHYRINQLLPKGADGRIPEGVLESLSGRLILGSLRDRGNLSLSEPTRLDGSGEAERRFIELYESLQELGWIDLIIFDPLVHFGGSEFEKDNAEASRLIRRFQRLTGLEGAPAVLLLHYPPKRKVTRLADAIRGASALQAGAGWSGLLRRVDEDESGERFLEDEQGRTVLELVVTKSNHGPSGLSVRYLTKGCEIDPIDASSDLLTRNTRLTAAEKKRRLQARSSAGSPLASFKRRKR